MALNLESDRRNWPTHRAGTGSPLAIRLWGRDLIPVKVGRRKGAAPAPVPCLSLFLSPFCMARGTRARPHWHFWRDTERSLPHPPWQWLSQEGTAYSDSGSSFSLKRPQHEPLTTRVTCLYVFLSSFWADPDEAKNPTTITRAGTVEQSTTCMHGICNLQPCWLRIGRSFFLLPWRSADCKVVQYRQPWKEPFQFPFIFPFTGES